MLKVENLTVAYGDILALHRVSFNVRYGELITIIGANGAGKSSLLNCLMGLIDVQKGCIVYEGNDITHWPSHQRARAGIRIVPERARIFPRLSVEQNLMIGGYGLKGRYRKNGILEEIFNLFPVLAERRDQTARTLSGGEQQQLAIGRALISEPRLLLVDEISTGLMPKLVDLVFSVIKRLNEEKGLTIVLVEQNAIQALAIAERGYILETGSIIMQGASSDLLGNREVQKAYLGS